MCNSGQARPKMTRKMRTIIEILTPHAQHYDNFLQNLWTYCSRHDRVFVKVSFYGEQFFYMTVKSRIWWAFLTGTATRYCKLTFLPGGRSGYSPILVWSISITFVNLVEMKAPFPGPEICVFRGCTKRRWFMEPAGSHTSAPLELWAYLKWNHTYVMKIKLYPHKFRASMPF